MPCLLLILRETCQIRGRESDVLQEFRQPAIPHRNYLSDENRRNVNRDYEYKHHEAVALLARINLQTREAIPLVRDRYSSKGYVEFFSLLDAKYPKGIKSDWYWIISKYIHPKKHVSISPKFPEGLSLYSHPNRVPG